MAPRGDHGTDNGYDRFEDLATARASRRRPACHACQAARSPGVPAFARNMRSFGQDIVCAFLDTLHFSSLLIYRQHNGAKEEDHRCDQAEGYC